MIARATADERRNSKRPSVTKTFGRLCIYSMTSVKSLRKADNRVGRPRFGPDERLSSFERYRAGLYFSLCNTRCHRQAYLITLIFVKTKSQRQRSGTHRSEKPQNGSTFRERKKEEEEPRKSYREPSHLGSERPHKLSIERTQRNACGLRT